MLAGGNIDATTLISVTRFGLTSSGRYLVVAILIPDRPGQLAEIVGVIARQRANVLAVTHYREGRNIGVLQTEAELTLETRDEEHSQAVIQALNDARFVVRRTAVATATSYTRADADLFPLREREPGRRRLLRRVRRLARGAPTTREERKVVSVVFVDLVGSTARAERLDPEDVRAQLASYHARVRTELERHGGTVEKFIGDAVVAVFGAPVVHEDDAERAVRASIAIRDTVAGPDVSLRVAVNTGEALVSLGARPDEGEGMVAGDVVNTAARLQSAAPVDGILVGEGTYRVDL